MINTRIEIDTTSSPYKINRHQWNNEPPALLLPYFTGKNDWLIFCDRIDLLLDGRGGLEEIKAMWMILGVVTTILLLGIVVGIVCTIVLVDDNGTLSIILGCLLAGLFLVFAVYFWCMKRLIVDGLVEFAHKVNTYCKEIAESKSNDAVTIRYGMNSSKCRLYWDRDFQCWIDVSTNDPIDLTTTNTTPKKPSSSSSKSKKSSNRGVVKDVPESHVEMSSKA